MKNLTAIIFSLLTFIFCLSALAYPPPPNNYRISTPADTIYNEEQIWVSPVDSNIVVTLWRVVPEPYDRLVRVARSTDAGNSWVDSAVTITLKDIQSDPCVDVDNEGNFFLGFMDFDPGDSGTITILKSYDSGASWQHAASLPIDTAMEDKPFITVDRSSGPNDGYLYTAWARYSGEQGRDTLMFARLPKDGSEFDRIYPIVDPPDFSYCGIPNNIWAGQWCQPLVGSDGSVYVFFESREVDSTFCQLHYFIGMVKSVNGGETMSPLKKIFRLNNDNWWPSVDGGIVVPPGPIGAVDNSDGPFDGNIYIIATNMDTANTAFYDFNLEFIRSSDGGVTWSDPIYINDDPTGPGAMFDQFMPWMFCNQDGTIIVIFYDQRMDPVFHRKFDVFAAYSFDGGESITTNHRITEVSSDPLLFEKNNKSRGGKIGEYIGVTAFKDHINAVWTDGRNGVQEVWGANWVTPLLEPRLLLPADGETIAADNLTLKCATSWKNNDDRYRVEIATDSQFVDMILTDITDTNSITITNKTLEDGLYYWRAKTFKISTGDSSEYSQEWAFSFIGYICGDVNDDNKINVLDVTFLIRYLYQGGNAPDPLNCADVNNDGTVSLLDITYLIAYLYQSGPEPDCP